MTGRIPLATSRRRLAILWYGFATPCFGLLLLQTLTGTYVEGDVSHVMAAWSWLLPNLMPTLSLATGVLAADAFRSAPSVAGKPGETGASRFFYRLTFGISLAYLLVVLALVLAPAYSSTPVLEVFEQSGVYLGPFQGLVGASFGAFFLSGDRGKRAGE
jgi:hypothetical protein